MKGMITNFQHQRANPWIKPFCQYILKFEAKFFDQQRCNFSTMTDSQQDEKSQGPVQEKAGSPAESNSRQVNDGGKSPSTETANKQSTPQEMTADGEADTSKVTNGSEKLSEQRLDEGTTKETAETDGVNLKASVENGEEVVSSEMVENDGVTLAQSSSQKKMAHEMVKDSKGSEERDGGGTSVSGEISSLNTTDLQQRPVQKATDSAGKANGRQINNESESLLTETTDKENGEGVSEQKVEKGVAKEETEYDQEVNKAGGEESAQADSQNMVESKNIAGAQHFSEKNIAQEIVEAGMNAFQVMGEDRVLNERSSSQGTESQDKGLEETVQKKVPVPSTAEANSRQENDEGESLITDTTNKEITPQEMTVDGEAESTKLPEGNDPVPGPKSEVSAATEKAETEEVRVEYSEEVSQNGVDGDEVATKKKRTQEKMNYGTFFSQKLEEGGKNLSQEMVAIQETPVIGKRNIIRETSTGDTGTYTIWKNPQIDQKQSQEITVMWYNKKIGSDQKPSPSISSSRDDTGPQPTHSLQGMPSSSGITTQTYLHSLKSLTGDRSTTEVYQGNVKNYVSFIVKTAAATFEVDQGPQSSPSGLKSQESLSSQGGKEEVGATRHVSKESNEAPKKKTKKEKGHLTLPPLVTYRPGNFEAHSTRQTYLSYPPLSQLPYYPKLEYPRKWGVPLLPAEPRTVLVGFTCPPAPRFRQDQLMTHSASTLRRYYSKPCIKSVEWIKVSGKR
ncbi:hypothetical protein ElyMa_004266800 [Elysia marginata]|uniref:Uncharacterized protein n=1 Tax=Elysia marginata TaxID=1093978 RepID=A0AAV4GT27_9GAST|nr:hypothetical protein ElyMa_004266800 [Elysia marginata]